MANIEEQVRIEVMNEIDLSYDVSDLEIRELIRNKIIEKSKMIPLSLCFNACILCAYAKYLDFFAIALLLSKRATNWPPRFRN